VSACLRDLADRHRQHPRRGRRRCSSRRCRAAAVSPGSRCCSPARAPADGNRSPFKVGAAPSCECAVISVAGSSMTSQPASGFPPWPATGTRPGSPRSAPTRGRGPWPAPGDLVQGPGIGQLQGAPHRGVAGLGAENRSVMGQQGDVVHAGGPERDRHRHAHQRDTPVHQRELPGPCQRRSQRGSQPRLVGQFAQQRSPCLPDQAPAAAGRSPSARGSTAYRVSRRALLPENQGHSVERAAGFGLILTARSRGGAGCPSLIWPDCPSHPGRRWRRCGYRLGS
jgi:hypothetical protein